MDRPKLRPIEAFPIEASGRRLIYIRDPLHYGKDLVVSPALIEVIRYFDGAHTIRDIQAKLMLKSGELIYSDMIENIAREMDEHLFLDSERFREVRNKVQSEFAASDVRQVAHAGTSYEAKTESLREQLQNFFVTEGGAGMPRMDKGRGNGHKTLAIIAPHIDLRCAGPCYSWAYREFAEGVIDCETVIILGTSHYGSGGLFIITEKDFETPLGRLETDREFITALRLELGDELNGDEGAHRLEHSIEFQTIFLQTIFYGRKMPKIVPILVTSFQSLIEKVDRPDQYEEFARFTAALRSVVTNWPRSVSFVVGADLAHIGRKFGDKFAAQTRLSEVERTDLEMLKYIEAGDANGFFNFIKAERDSRRVCGFPPILTLLATVENLEGKLLKYEQWSETATESAVTYASLAFYNNKAS
jgi:MEMO1 family protein